jgi:hypothetical protein
MESVMEAYRWKPTRYGLEAYMPGARRPCYGIPKEDLGDVCQYKGGGKLSEWIMHLSGKGWFDPDLFEGPFRAALQRHNVEATFDIPLSLYVARVRRARSKLYSAVSERLYPSESGKGPRPWRIDEMNRVASEVNRLLKPV